MEKDILVILMFAFGIFAVVMFILFYIYLRKYYKSKHINDDYKKEIDDNIIDEEEEVKPVVTPTPPVENIEPHIEEIPPVENIDNDMEFIPIKKK